MTVMEESGQDDGPALLRALVARGGPILAYASPRCPVLPALMPALAATGRLGDLRVLQLAHPDRHGRLLPESRRPSPDTFPAYDPACADPDDGGTHGAPLSFLADIYDPRDVPDGWRRRGTAPSWARVLPRMPLREILAPRAVVVVWCKDCDPGAAQYFARLVSLAREAAEAERRATPTVIETLGNGIPPEGGPGVPIGAHVAARHGGDPVRIEEAPAAAPAARVAYRGGVASGRDGDRLVVAVDRGRGAAGGRLHVYEVSRDGWVTGVGFDLVAPGRAEAVAAAQIVLERGTGPRQDGEAWCRMKGLMLTIDAPERAILEAGPAVGRLVASHAPDGVASGIGEVWHGHAALVSARGSRARRAFIGTWPAFAGLLLDPAFAAAIDAGGETVPLIAARLRIGKGVARRLVGLARTPLPLPKEIQDHSGPLPLGDLLGAIGHASLPKAGDAAGWDALAGCCRRVMAMRRRMDHGFDWSVAGSLLRGMKGPDWPARLDRIARWEAAGMRLSDCGDFVLGTRDWLEILLDARIRVVRVLPLLAGRLGLGRMLDASADWHADQELHAPCDLDPTPWGRAFETVRTGDGWSVRVLGSNAELQAEGARGPDRDGLPGLAHCVAAYGLRCRSGESVILSVRRVRDGVYRRVSTAELVRDEAGDWVFPGCEARYGLAQHRGAGNAEPEADAADSLDRTRRLIREGEVRIFPKFLWPREDGPAGAGADDAEAGDGTGLAWAEHVFPRYRALFPAPWRTMDLDAFRAGMRDGLHVREPGRDGSGAVQGDEGGP